MDSTFNYDAHYHTDGYPKQKCRQCGDVIHLACHMQKWEYGPDWQFFPQTGQQAKGICKGKTLSGWYFLHFAVKVGRGWSHRIAYFKEKSKHFK